MRYILQLLSRFLLRLMVMLLSIMMLSACGSMNFRGGKINSPPTSIDPVWGSVLQRHSIAVGETVSIDLPRFPLTGKTEYWQIRKEKRK